MGLIWQGGFRAYGCHAPSGFNEATPYEVDITTLAPFWPFSPTSFNEATPDGVDVTTGRPLPSEAANLLQ